MPELPEVETMVRGIRPEVEGRTISEVEFCKCDRRPITVLPQTREFQRRQRGCRIEKVTRLAKRVVLHLDSGDCVVIEPRMTGLMLVADPPTVEHRRICWHLKRRRGRRDSFEFWDRRGLGTAKLLDSDQMQALQQKLGPDALTMPASELHSRLSGTRRAIKVVLLDQSVVAGIGNLYASEILHRAKIHPERPACDLNRRQLTKLVECCRHILEKAIRYEGSTLSDGTYRNALNSQGGYQNEHVVYQKEGQTCPICSRGSIRKIVQAQRSTFFCPTCQRMR